MPRTDDSAAFAANWRAVLAIDGGIGVLVSIVGVAVVFVVSVAVGFLVIAVGALYAGMVGARARRWVRLRREAGLP
jgi:hypothetical protein